MSRKMVFVVFLVGFFLFTFSALTVAEGQKFDVKEVYIAGYFDSGKYELTNQIQDQLREFISLIPVSDAVITLEGFADSTGTPEKNQELAIKRADEVEGWLKRLRPDIAIVMKKGVIYDEESGQRVNSRIVRLKICVPEGTLIKQKDIAGAVVESDARRVEAEKKQEGFLTLIVKDLKKLLDRKVQVEVKSQDYTANFEHTWFLLKSLVVLMAFGFLAIAFLVLKKMKP